MSRATTPEWRAIADAPCRADEIQGLARRLGELLTALPPSSRVDRAREVLGYLLGERRAYGLTLFLLAELDDEELVRTLADRLQPIPAQLFEADEAYLAELVRLTASAPETAGHASVEAYLLERPVGPHWPTVAWALWPRRKELFGRAWARYFDAIDPSLWDDPSVLDAFLATPDAVGRVRDAIGGRRRSSWPSIREAIRRRAHRSTWLGDEQRRALASSLE